MSEVIQEHKISLYLASGEVLDVSIYDDNIADRVEKEMLNQKFNAVVESVDIEHIEHKMPDGSAFLEGWFDVPELQSIIVQILAGLRGVGATTIEYPEYVLVIFSSECNGGFTLSDIAVWEKERWETFKALVDTRETWPAVLHIARECYIKLEDANSVRRCIQSSSLEELGPVFFGILESLPVGNIIESIWGVFVIEPEEPARVVNMVSGDEEWS